MSNPNATAMAELDPLTLPLHGRRLIEASAGTGKTWTIAALYVRMVLGHGLPQPLLPPAILVLTFTDAATADLRERIRLRLVEAARCFAGGPGDGFLQALREDIASERHGDCVRLLQGAAQWMDEAAIHTIHAWCQRMLTRHAFASGSAFATTLEADQRERVADGVRDWWRQRVYPLPATAARAVLSLWDEPASLHHDLQPLLRAVDSKLQVHGVPLHAPADWLAEVDEWVRWRASTDAGLDAARGQWRDAADGIASLLLDAQRAGCFKANMIKPDAWGDEIAAMQAWSVGAQLPEKAHRFTPNYLSSATKKGAAVPTHPALEALATALASAAAAPDLRHSTLADALAFVRRHVDQRQRQLSRIGFDDLLTRLDTALYGNHGDALAASLRAEFPLAMVDEFQDTDRIQYRIFSRVWSDPGASEGGLLLIGDPKQAIYAFRGADIHTYLAARNQALPPLYTLATNHRATTAMVAAVNRLFGRGEQRAPDGAFAFAGKGLPFHPVRAQGRRERWQVGGNDQAALTLWHLPSEAPLPMGAYVDAMAGLCADGIAGLLGRGDAGFASADGFTPLRAADIAVLVRSRNEAELIRGALSARGLRSVYLSDRDSVYASSEAADVLLWLRACADPGSDRALRAALATATLDLDLADIDRLSHDETWRDQLDQRFHGLQAIGRQRGVLAMLHAFLHRFELPARLLARPGGERSLTNVLHLAELLQHAAQGLHGEQALIRHLEEALADDTGEDDARMLRLESDAGLIRVVTVHKAKGLEYPLVFVPFACAFKAKSPPLQFHVDGERHVELAGGDDDAGSAATQAALRESLQEDVRLLYVAVTRARHACWLGVAGVRHGRGSVTQLERSAFGYLLGGGEAIALHDVAAQLHSLAADDGSIAVSAPPAPASVAMAPSGGETLAPARIVTATAPQRWWISSYSALAMADAVQTRRDSADTPREDVMVESTASDDDIAASDPDAGAIHRFPRGAEPGTFLHGLFEWVADAGFGHCADHPAPLREQIARRCERRGWQAWIRPLADWLPALLRRPLALPDAGSVALADLAAGTYRAELEFWIQAHAVDTRRLDALVSGHTLDRAARPALAADVVHGLFKGFIDLVFEHGGRYFVLDYKSNRLGDGVAAYSRERMRASILAERYDLQYSLYLLALHRQLKARLPDYDPARHLGGAVYVYLRGVDGSGLGVHVERPPVALIEMMDEIFAAGGNHDNG